MKKISLLLFVSAFAFCKHKTEDPVLKLAPPVCPYKSNINVSFSAVILPLLKKNCGDCHTSPGSGGIILDNYLSIKNVAASGELITVVSNADPNNIMMPPPPLHHLDSCQITAIHLWVEQGYQNN